VTGIEIPHSRLARFASDHLPLVAEIRIPDSREPFPSSGYSAAQRSQDRTSVPG
jgi:hypothetical protein